MKRLQKVVARDHAGGWPTRFLPVALDLEDDICRDETDSHGTVLTAAPAACAGWRKLFGKVVYTEMVREWVRMVVAGLHLDPPMIAFYVSPIYADDNNLVVGTILDGTGLTGDQVIVWMPKYTTRGEWVAENELLRNRREDEAFRNLCRTVSAPQVRCRFHQYTQTALFDGTPAIVRDMPADELRKLGPIDVNRFIGSRDEFEKILISLPR